MDPKVPAREYDSDPVEESVAEPASAETHVDDEPTLPDRPPTWEPL